jgi:hypothetical protein
MSALFFTELECCEQASRLRRIVVRDRSLETLAPGRRLAELPAQPAEQADGVRARHGGIVSHAARLPLEYAPVD